MALLLAVPALGLGCGLAAMMLARAPVLPMPLPVLPASLAPQEADMPPLAESLARIAAESTIAACWAARLQPGGSSCAVGAAAR